MIILSAFIVSIGLIIFVVVMGAPARAAAKAERLARSEERRKLLEAAEAEKALYKEKLREDWVLNECVYKGASGWIAMKADCRTLAVFPYKLSDTFFVGEAIEIPVEQILSAGLVREQVKETYYRTEIVPVGLHNKKSPVARGLVGGALLGPAGVVVGAASGLGGKSKVVTEERKVLDERLVEGTPTLKVGTASRHGVVNINFLANNHADHWLNQIRNARVSLSLPPLPY